MLANAPAPIKEAGIKHDRGKPDITLIPYSAMAEEAYAFMLGEWKYSRYNFTKGLRVTRLCAAAIRHIMTYMWQGWRDEESGASHLGHARACLGMVIETMYLGTAVDDRPEWVEKEPEGYNPIVRGWLPPEEKEDTNE